MADHKIFLELLDSWENTYKKGQLTLWIFMALKTKNMYVDEIKAFIEQKSKNTLSCEEQSLYRSLRKFEHLEIVSYTLKDGNKGPERKYYHLTKLGEQLLESFVQRNIKLFFDNEIKSILNL